MGRILALDIGDRRIGYAVSDPFNSYALPLKTYTRVNIKTDLQYAVDLAKEKCADLIVCGLPVNADGTPSIQTDRTGHFIERLRGVTDIKIITIDERYTTVEAENELTQMDVSRREKKQYVDSLAAAFILEGYLNSKK